MKIAIRSALKKEEIKQLLDGQTIQGITFTHAGTLGADIKFEVDTTDQEAAISTAKKTVKSAPFGAAILFSVTVVK